MEIIYLIIGLILGGTLAYFFVNASKVSRKDLEITQQENIKLKADESNHLNKLNELESELNKCNEKQSQLLNSSEAIKVENGRLGSELAYKNQQIIDLKTDIEKKYESMEQLVQERNELQISHSDLTANNQHLKKQLDTQKEEIEKLQEMAKNEFQNLANKILEEKSEKFTLQNQQNIKNLLGPLQEKINDFEKKVENTHKESIDYHAALRQQIIGLKELNQKMSEEAVNLTKALKGDNKIQGNWGELILENVLQKSGLEKDREYEVQKSHSTDEGRLQPDVIINLPDGKKMIIDSKVSLNAYERWVNEEDDLLKEQFLQEHLLSLKRHIEQLSGKNYQNLYHIESPDFVLLFVPIEPAFALAINADNQLYNKAFEKSIVIVTPTTLLATLKTIDSMWTNKKQQDNSIEIARQAGAMYDKFAGFVNDLVNVGSKMDDAKSEYQAAMNKLVSGRGNLVKSSENLKKLGAKAKKSLPENLLSRADALENEFDLENENETL
ncbi:MAG: DNA recombination protein RmuC [Bacteroidetes bacterium]|nr:DNA recombination protein RmuC [Bacteroidota bacterium]